MQRGAGSHISKSKKKNSIFILKSMKSQSHYEIKISDRPVIDTD